MGSSRVNVISGESLSNTNVLSHENVTRLLLPHYGPAIKWGFFLGGLSFHAVAFQIAGTPLLPAIR